MEDIIPDENYIKELRRILANQKINLSRSQTTFKDKSHDAGYLKNVSTYIKMYKDNIKSITAKINGIIKLQKSKKMAGLKKFDVVYSTKSGRLMVAKSVMANSAEDAKEKLKSQMRSSDTFDKIRLVMGLNSPLPNGLRKAVAKTIKVTGLRKSNGTLQKGYKYVKGGKIVKVKATTKTTTKNKK